MTTSWRQSLRPASFRGAGFKVEIAARAGGRRTVLHEYPKRDDPYTEDMGRRGRRFTVTGYVIGDDYIQQRDELVTACEKEGSGLLVHPTMGEFMVICEVCNTSESRQRGGMAEFDMNFVEAGSAPNNAPTTDTQGQTSQAANDAGQTAATATDTNISNVDTSYGPQLPVDTSYGPQTSVNTAYGPQQAVNTSYGSQLPR